MAHELAVAAANTRQQARPKPSQPALASVVRIRNQIAVEVGTAEAMYWNGVKPWHVVLGNAAPNHNQGDGCCANSYIPILAQTQRMCSGPALAASCAGVFQPGPQLMATTQGQ